MNEKQYTYLCTEQNDPKLHKNSHHGLYGETRLACKEYQDEDKVSACWPIPFSLKHAGIKRILGYIIPKEELCKEHSLRIYKDHFECLVCLM